METEIGKLYLVAENQKLSAIHFGMEDFLANEKGDQVVEKPDDELLLDSVAQLGEYFSGKELSLNFHWNITGLIFKWMFGISYKEIPFGTTKSYLDIAISIGRPKAVRAVGQANKANQLPIIVPCHRVIGKNQTLTGYAGTRTEIKEKLVQLQGASFKQ